MKYLHWIVIGIIVLVVLIVAPRIVPEIFHAIADIFSTLFKSAKDVGGGVKEGLPPIK